VRNFYKNPEHKSKFSPPEVKQEVPYCRSTNSECHRTKFGRPGDMERVICAPLLQA